MASDLIQRAAAICGYPFTPNSDQLAEWLDDHGDVLSMSFDRSSSVPGCNWGVAFGSWSHEGALLECLAAAVVEVDRIGREAANAHQA